MQKGDFSTSDKTQNNKVNGFNIWLEKWQTQLELLDFAHLKQKNEKHMSNNTLVIWLGKWKINFEQLVLFIQDRKL